MHGAGCSPSLAAEDDDSRSGRDRGDAWLAVVCLLPDPGHVIPLLKIAAQVASPDEALVLTPDELVPLVEAAGFSGRGFGPVRPEEGFRHVQNYVAASEPRRMTGAFRTYLECYFQPLRAAITEATPRLEAHLRKAAPRVVLMDEHLVPPALRSSLRNLKTRWLLHSPAPNYTRHNTWSFMNCWWPDRRTAVRDAVEKCRNEIRLRARWRGAAGGPPDPDHARPISDRFAPGKRQRLSSGKAALEAIFLRDRLLYAGEGRIVLPALPPLETPLDPDLARWLDGRQDGSVVYVSFGTVVRPPAVLLRAIVDAALGEGREVLLQSDQPVDARAGLHQKSWVAQQRVLAHPAVGLFVSHGGAGSIEEALWSGTPVVSIPKVWDHDFNAWVAESLGVGVYLRRGWRVGQAELRAGLRHALRAEVATQAAALSRFMQADWEDNREAVLDLFSPGGDRRQRLER